MIKVTALVSQSVALSCFTWWDGNYQTQMVLNMENWMHFTEQIKQLFFFDCFQRFAFLWL
jgi:hypothetical protein